MSLHVCLFEDTLFRIIFKGDQKRTHPFRGSPFTHLLSSWTLCHLDDQCKGKDNLAVAGQSIEELSLATLCSLDHISHCQKVLISPHATSGFGECKSMRREDLSFGMEGSFDREDHIGTRRIGPGGAVLLLVGNHLELGGTPRISGSYGSFEFLIAGLSSLRIV